MFFGFFLLVVLLSAVRAGGWEVAHTATLSASVGQAQYENWLSGGEDSFWWILSLDGEVVFAHRFGAVVLCALGASFGQLYAGGEFRKHADELSLEVVASRKARRSVVEPYLALRLLTQFAPGYSYSETVRVQLSGAFDPLYLQEGAGVMAAFGGFSGRVGVAARQVVTRRFTQYSDDPTTEAVEKLRNDIGLEVVSGFRGGLGEGASAQGEARLFVYEGGVKAELAAEVVAKVASVFSLGASLKLRYDPDVCRKVQLAQELSAGLLFTL